MATSSSSAATHQDSESVSGEPSRKNTLEVVPEITPSETPGGDHHRTTPTKTPLETSNTTEDMDKLVTALQTPPNMEIANASISISSGTTMGPTGDGENRFESNQSEKEWKRPCSDMRWNVSCFAMFVGAILYGKLVQILLSSWCLLYTAGLDTTIAADVQGPILKSLGNIEKLAVSQLSGAQLDRAWDIDLEIASLEFFCGGRSFSNYPGFSWDNVSHIILLQNRRC